MMMEKSAKNVIHRAFYFLFGIDKYRNKFVLEMFRSFFLLHFNLKMYLAFL